MHYLLDTCVLIDVSRQHTGALKFIKELKYKPSLSVLTLTEFKAGVKKEQEHAFIDRLSASLNVHVVDVEIASLAGEYLNLHSKKHGVGVVDSLLAATAKMHGLTLATHNVKHFPMLKNNEIAMPY